MRLFPTHHAVEQAARVQAAVIVDDLKDTSSYNQEQTSRATMRTRQDLVLLIALQQATHAQLVTIARGVWALVFIALLAVAALL